MINNHIPCKFMDPMASEYNNSNTIRWSKSIDHLMTEQKFEFGDMRQLEYTKITACMALETFFERYYPLMTELERDLSLFMHECIVFDDSNIYIIDNKFAILITTEKYGYFIIAPREHEGSYDVSMWYK